MPAPLADRVPGRSPAKEGVIDPDTAHRPTLETDTASRHAAATGDWRIDTIAPIARELERPRDGDGGWSLELSGLATLDTAGAVCLERLRRWLGEDTRVAGASAHHRALLELVAGDGGEPPPPRHEGGLARLGRHAVERGARVTGFLAFTGELTVDVLPRLLRPHRLRWRAIVAGVEQAGLYALPIVGLLAFLMGVVMTYQGGSVLRSYGANIFLVDLIGITMLREMGPLLAAIIVAGRTGSAYAAEIGTMRITEEVDALRTLGITPYEMLVLPRVVALAVAMPLLSVWADAMGVLGGMIVASGLYDVSLATFLDRLPYAVPVRMFWAGIGKTPVFALLIAMVGCYHGLRVRGSAEEVGRATTMAVVQSIFLVIIADAAFSVVFQQFGI